MWRGLISNTLINKRNRKLYLFDYFWSPYCFIILSTKEDGTS